MGGERRPVTTEMFVIKGNQDWPAEPNVTSICGILTV